MRRELCCGKQGMLTRRRWRLSRPSSGRQCPAGNHSLKKVHIQERSKMQIVRVFRFRLLFFFAVFSVYSLFLKKPIYQLFLCRPKSGMYAIHYARSLCGEKKLHSIWRNLKRYFFSPPGHLLFYQFKHDLTKYLLSVTSAICLRPVAKLSNRCLLVLIIKGTSPSI